MNSMDGKSERISESRKELIRGYCFNCSLCLLPWTFAISIQNYGNARDSWKSNLSLRRPYPDGASLRYQNFVHWRSGDDDGAATQESVIKSHCPEAIIGDHFVTFRSRSTFNMECLSRALVTRLTTSAVLSGRIVKDVNLH
jgi:hypothetical protein